MKQSTKLALKVVAMTPFQFIWIALTMMITQPLLVIHYLQLKRQFRIHSTLAEFLYMTNMSVIHRIFFNLKSNLQTIKEVRTEEIKGLI